MFENTFFYILYIVLEFCHLIVTKLKGVETLGKIRDIIFCGLSLRIVSGGPMALMSGWHLIFRACAGSFYIFFSLFMMRQLCCWEIWALLKWTPKTNAFSMQIFILSPAFGQLVYRERLWNLLSFFFQTYQRREECNIYTGLFIEILISDTLKSKEWHYSKSEI